jgi:hypothetical protein
MDVAIISDSAVSAIELHHVTTKPLLTPVRDPMTLRPLLFIAPARSTRVARSAGRRPITIPVTGRPAITLFEVRVHVSDSSRRVIA